jgi:glycosyltransferase involved in cell wall biosynthesis
MKLRIAILTDGITPFVTGGMQRHSANLAKYFTKQGVEVVLVSCVPFGAKLPSEAEINQELFGRESFKLFKCITLHFPAPGKIPGHYIRNSYTYSKRVFEAISFENIDFVYAKGFVGWKYMEEKRKNSKLPPIGVKFHGYEMYQELPTIKQKIEAKILRKATKWNNENADVIFSYGGKITKLITDKIGVSRDQIVEFTSGLDSDWLRSTNVQRPNLIYKFVFVGRNETRKGINELNQSIRELIKVNENFQFSFVGPIPMESQINASQVIYVGELNTKESICQILDAADVLVCPSHAEGMPNVILEGMARGLAIIATDVGAVEIIVDGSNGALIPALDQRALTDTLLKFIQMDAEELHDRKKSSWQKVNKSYLWEQIAAETIGAIDRLIKN